MKIQSISIGCLLFVLHFSVATNTQAQNSILASVDKLTEAAAQPTDATTTNANEVLTNLNQRLFKNLTIDSDLFQYYNSTVSFVITFVIDEKGKIKKVQALHKAKGPIVAAVIKKVKAMKKMPVVLENGRSVAKQFFLPIQITE